MKIAVGVSLLFHGFLLASLALYKGSLPISDTLSSPIAVSLVSPSLAKSAPAITREESLSEPVQPLPISEPISPVTDAEPVPADITFPQEAASTLSLDEIKPAESPGQVSQPESGSIPEPVVAPALISELTVVYPYKARKKGYEGQVLCHVRVGTDGTVLEATVSSSSGYDLLDKAALEAVSAAEYSPGTREDLVEVNVVFQLS